MDNQGEFKFIQKKIPELTFINPGIVGS